MPSPDGEGGQTGALRPYDWDVAFAHSHMQVLGCRNDCLRYAPLFMLARADRGALDRGRLRQRAREVRAPRCPALALALAFALALARAARKNQRVEPQRDPRRGRPDDRGRPLAAWKGGWRRGRV
jgi:hypothetical protein